MITPTIGRKVWYWPVNETNVTRYNDLEPLDATVICVWSDTCVNLRITDNAGNQHVRTSVFLHQGEPSDRPESSCATWMPYQVGQSKKHETS